MPTEKNKESIDSKNQEIPHFLKEENAPINLLFNQTAHVLLLTDYLGQFDENPVCLLAAQELVEALLVYNASECTTSEKALKGIRDLSQLVADKINYLLENSNVD